MFCPHHSQIGGGVEIWSRQSQLYRSSFIVIMGQRGGVSEAETRDSLINISALKQCRISCNNPASSITSLTISHSHQHPLQPPIISSTLICLADRGQGSGLPEWTPHVAVLLTTRCWQFIFSYESLFVIEWYHRKLDTNNTVQGRAKVALGKLQQNAS